MPDSVRAVKSMAKGLVFAFYQIRVLVPSVTNVTNSESAYDRFLFIVDCFGYVLIIFFRFGVD